jgi:sialic acid synthase SpsE
MKIDNFDIDREVLVVAEIGNNHEGSESRAEDLIGHAAECGVGAVKFQTFRTEQFVSPRDPARFQRLKSFELSFDAFDRLSAVARDNGLLFISTPLDLTSADFLAGIVSAFKIGSCENTFYPLLDRVARFGKPVILSSGLVDIAQIQTSKSLIENIWRDLGFHQQLVVLHCVTSYPAPIDQVNLGAIHQLRDQLDCTIGYSDHTLGIDAPVLAVAMGARVVEKHFTLDKNFSDFRDHHLSATPAEMKALVTRIREVGVLLGSGFKAPQPCERAITEQVRRSIAAKHDLAAGARIGWDNIMWVRPGGGLPPGKEHLVVGHTLRDAVRAGDLLAPELLED